MQITKVNLPAGVAQNYSIFIGSGILPKIAECVDIKKYSNVAVVTTEEIAKLEWFKEFADNAKIIAADRGNLIKIEGAESSKNINTVAMLWDRFQKLALDRKSLVITIGGGALCDMSGFAASTYMRGIAFAHVPTTLLAQVDASIGGKVGINCAEVKNLIGNFAQPKAVVVDIETLKSLPKRELCSGFAEVIKHGLIQNKDYYELVKNHSGAIDESGFLTQVVAGSSQIKAQVVAADETETGLRKVLNFGHTIGHALESISHKLGTPLLHGEAVSLGMVAEAKLSELIGYLSSKDVLDIEKTLRQYELPIRLTFDCKDEDVMQKVRADKKNVASAIKWSLLERIGCASFDKIADDQLVLKAIDYLRHE